MASLVKNRGLKADNQYRIRGANCAVEDLMGLAVEKDGVR